MAKKKKEEGGGAPDWVLTYGDMMSLLLTFFIMLYSISSMSPPKALAISQAMQRQFGFRPQMFVPVPGSRFEQGTNEGRSEKNKTIQEKNPARKNNVPTRAIEEMTTTATVLFRTGSDELDDAARKMIQAVLPQLQGRPQKIELRGHASPDETGQFRDFMDLSYTRAHNVRTYLVELGIKESRIEIKALGVNDPIPESVEPTPGANSSVEITLLSAAGR